MLLLQRVPALRPAAVMAENLSPSRVVSLLRAAFTASASLGAVHSLAGATQLVASPVSPLSTTTGATVHIVDAGVDTGPVLAQREVAIAAGVSETELHEQIKAVERTLIVEVVAEIAEGKLNLSERAN